MKSTIFVFLLSLLFSFQAISQKTIQATYPIGKKQSLVLNLPYAEKIKINIGKQGEVRYKALLDITDTKGNSLNEQYKITKNTQGNEIKISGKISNFKAQNVIAKAKTNTQKWKKKGLVTGTQYEVWVPKNVNLSVQSSIASVEIEHNNASLLVNTINHIDLTLDKSVSANFSLSSLLGKIDLDNKITADLSHDLNKRSVRMDIVTKDTSFSIDTGTKNLSLGNGTLEISLKTITGNIKIQTKN